MALAVIVSFVKEITLPSTLDWFPTRLTYRPHHLDDRKFGLTESVSFGNHEVLYFVLVFDIPKL